MFIEIYIMQQINAVSLTYPRSAVVTGHERKIKITVGSKAVDDSSKILFPADVLGMLLLVGRCFNFRNNDVSTWIVLDVFARPYCIFKSARQTGQCVFNHVARVSLALHAIYP